MEIKRIALITVIVLVAMVVLLPREILAEQGTPPDIKVSLALTDSQQDYMPARLVYDWNDPIPMVVTLENLGDHIVTTKGFSQRPFHLLLIFTDPDGITVLTDDPGDLYATDAPPPRVFPVQDQLIQVEPVESLAGAGEWVVRVEIPDAHVFYALEKPGNYSVKAVIPMRTYNQINYSGPQDDYSEIDDFKWSGALESNIVYFALLPKRILISPDIATITLGASHDYIAEAFDANDNLVGDVTSETTFTIEPDGSCLEATCTATMVGLHIVTGEYEEKKDTATLDVVYDFDGFFSPVNNPPTLNSVKVGQAVPVKFSLNGNQGLDIIAAGSPSSIKIGCDLNAQEETIEETVTAGGSSLQYDAATDQYTYVWKTNRTWANTCRQLTVKFKDGVEKRANFKFKR